MNRAPTQPALSRFNPAQPGAQGMKVIATGLLVVMAAVFFAARAFEARYPALAYLKAFAEAAMVGGLADWFAVTALFRHPLGVPIPHTAIIPRNKDRIGEALARFLQENFLIPSVVARRMRNIDVSGAVGHFLQTPSQDEQSRVRAGPARPSPQPPQPEGAAASPRRRPPPHRGHLRKPRRRAARRDRQERHF